MPTFPPVSREGRFRKDLLYRLDVIRVEIPPLRARPEDVLPLARHFLTDSAARFGRELRGFDAEAEAALLAYRWPGNARELRNWVKCAAAMADAPWIGLADLTPELAAPRALEEVLPTLAATVAAAERRAIQAALDATRETWQQRRTGSVSGGPRCLRRSAGSVCPGRRAGSPGVSRLKLTLEALGFEV